MNNISNEQLYPTIDWNRLDSGWTFPKKYGKRYVNLRENLHLYGHSIYMPSDVKFQQRCLEGRNTNET